jgi:hypothetical protein
LFHFRPDCNLQHAASGLFVHPLQGTASRGVMLVLHPDGPEPRLAFELDGEGCLRHRDSGLCVHPANGRGCEGSQLMFHPDGPDRAFEGEIAFKFESKASSELSAAVLSAEMKVAQCQAAVEQLAAGLSSGSSACSGDDDDSGSDDSSSYGEFKGYDAPAPVVEDAAAVAVESPAAPTDAAAAPADAAAAPTVSQDELAQQKALEQRRNTLLRTVQEILQTEDDYQANISFAICTPLFFLQDQLVHEPHKSGLQEGEVDLLKCNLQEMCHCSSQFLGKLESANNLAATGAPLLFGHVFKSFIPKFLDIYSHYCSNFEECCPVPHTNAAVVCYLTLLPQVRRVHPAEAV